MQKDEITEDVNENTNKLHKPLSIFMDDIGNFPLMLESFKIVLTDEEFSSKSMSPDSIKVNTSDTYRKLVHFLKVNNIAHFIRVNRVRKDLSELLLKIYIVQSRQW